MTRVLVLADTHVPDFAKELPARVFREAARSDLILHAGDVSSAPVLDQLADHAPVHVALGNNDGPDVARWGATEAVEIDIDGVAVAMVHDSGSRPSRERRMTRRFPEARVVVFGHSHIPLAYEHEGVRFLNPGSPTWKRRQPYPTYAVMTVARSRVTTRLVTLLE